MTLVENDFPRFITASTYVSVGGAGIYIYAAAAAAGWNMAYRDPRQVGAARRADSGIYRFVVLGTAGPLTLTCQGTDQFHDGGALVSTLTIMPGESVTLVNDGAYWLPLRGGITPSVYRKVAATQTGTTLTLDRTASVWPFAGTAAATWTLPSLLTNKGMEVLIKNRGSADLTVQRAGSDQLYTTAAVTSITVAAGASARIVNDGTYWLVL